MPTLTALTVEDRALWERHVRSSPAWEVRSSGSCLYAVRLEPREVNGSVVYKTTLNGYVTHTHAADGVYQTRVVTGLGCELGFGRDRGQVTRTAAGQGGVQLLLEDYMDQPGLNSYLLVSSASGLTLEVYEQGDPLERPFTRAVLTEVDAELAAVLAHREELSERGVIASLVPAGTVRSGPPTIQVEDGMQPGIYIVTAWVAPRAAGRVETRVFYDHPLPGSPPPAALGVPGEELSADRVRPRSTREIGWSEAGDQLFRYQSEVTVYEGDWGQPYAGRFEVWHVAPDGTEVQLIHTTRTIEGWMR